jgi:tetratricopeptide (TPR) repeat protein
MRALLVRLAFPVSLLVVVGILFVTLGPPAGDTRVTRLAAMAPPGAVAGEPYTPASDASPIETEIATRYETVRRFPETLDAYILLGNAYLQHVRETGDPADYGRAEAAFEAARRLDPQRADALVGLGSVSLARHQFAEALALGESAVALAPASSAAHGVLVDALTELGRYDEAVAATQRMVDLRPNLASLSRVSYQRELRGDLDGAIAAMSRAYDAATGAATENREYVRVLIGDLHLLAGDVDTAEQIYRASLATLPSFVPARAGLGRVAAARGDMDAAIEHYGAASAAVPLPDLLVAKAEAELVAGRLDEAAQTLELVRGMQELYAANGVSVELELALFEANHGDPSRAVQLSEAAYRNQPNVQAADALAWALFRAGRLEEAAAKSREALALGSPYPTFHFHAGMIALSLGDRTDAAENLEQALAGAGTLSPLDLRTARDAITALRAAP